MRSNALALLALVTLIFLIVPVTSNADWKQFDQTESMVIYLDLDKLIETENETYIIRNLVDFYLPQTAHPEGLQITFQSLIRYIEINCVTEETKTHRIEFFERVNGQGKMVLESIINSIWRSSQNESESTVFMNLVCGGRSA